MRRIAHALASLRWRLTLTFVGLLGLLLVLLAGYQYFTLRASLISNRVGEMQTDFNSATRVLATVERGLGATATGRTLCRTHPELAGAAVARSVSAVTGETVQVVVFNRGLSQVAVAPIGSTPPQLEASTLQRVASTGTRSAAQVGGNGTADATPTCYSARRLQTGPGFCRPQVHMNERNIGEHDRRSRGVAGPLRPGEPGGCAQGAEAAGCFFY